MNREAVIEQLRALRPPNWGGTNSFRDLFLATRDAGTGAVERAGGPYETAEEAVARLRGVNAARMLTLLEQAWVVEVDVPAVRPRLRAVSRRDAVRLGLRAVLPKPSLFLDFAAETNEGVPVAGDELTLVAALCWQERDLLSISCYGGRRDTLLSPERLTPVGRIAFGAAESFDRGPMTADMLVGERLVDTRLSSTDHSPLAQAQRAEADMAAVVLQYLRALAEDEAVALTRHEDAPDGDGPLGGLGEPRRPAILTTIAGAPRERVAEPAGIEEPAPDPWAPGRSVGSTVQTRTGVMFRMMMRAWEFDPALLAVRGPADDAAWVIVGERVAYGATTDDQALADIWEALAGAQRRDVSATATPAAFRAAVAGGGLGMGAFGAALLAAVCEPLDAREAMLIAQDPRTEFAYAWHYTSAGAWYLLADRGRCAAAMCSVQELGLLGEMTEAVDRAEYAG
ncbi:hypothetical protein [Candidatus Solirubrobacter pratensis]|uniref:hypothetical protein n=1 Tax=Candidatus Solirubrobacter pratensis TaxID=1298857 RepID=UPI000407A7E4|nr:hypothetical protein [Candidatus Solirubrobacter pratensis]